MTAAKQILGPGKTLAPGMTAGKARMRGPPACHADPARREKHPRIPPEKCPSGTGLCSEWPRVSVGLGWWGSRVFFRPSGAPEDGGAVGSPMAYAMG